MKEKWYVLLSWNYGDEKSCDPIDGKYKYVIPRVFSIWNII